MDRDALRRTAEEARAFAADTQSAIGTRTAGLLESLGCAVLTRLDREAAAQRVLASLAPRLEEVRRQHAADEGSWTQEERQAASVHADRAFLLTVVDVLAALAAEKLPAAGAEVCAY